MKTAIIIPVYNEEAYLEQMLSSLVAQTKRPTQVVLVDDNSTDNSSKIIHQFSKTHPWISSISTTATPNHSPGSKVVNAFYVGYKIIEKDIDLIGKFDADIILPENYFEKIYQLFQANPTVGLAGGNLYIEEKGNWVFENISEKTKVRGPIKLYRINCFGAIGGLKKSIGWDTVDGLLANYHGWDIKTDTTLKVKHLKPTGKAYTAEARHKQGEAFFKMRYGKTITRIAALKLAIAKKDLKIYIHCMQGYHKAKKQKMPFIVTKEEGVFIRNLRWKGIKKKIL